MVLLRFQFFGGSPDQSKPHSEVGHFARKGLNLGQIQLSKPPRIHERVPGHLTRDQRPRYGIDDNSGWSNPGTATAAQMRVEAMISGQGKPVRIRRGPRHCNRRRWVLGRNGETRSDQPLEGVNLWVGHWEGEPLGVVRKHDGSGSQETYHPPTETGGFTVSVCRLFSVPCLLVTYPESRPKNQGKKQAEIIQTATVSEFADDCIGWGFPEPVPVPDSSWMRPSSRTHRGVYLDSSFSGQCKPHVGNDNGLGLGSRRSIFFSSICAGLVLLAAAGFPSVSNAQDSTFSSEITVTATGTQEGLEDVPLPITVITEEEMENAQTESVADILRRVPGLNVVQSSGPGSVTSIFTRGTESDHTLVMIDGVRLNSPYFGGFDFSQLATAGLGRIEVARGPYSALWGADAIGGVINLIPGTGTDGFEGSLSGEWGGGSWERYEGAITYGSEDFDLMASGLMREGEGDLENSDFNLQQGLVNAGFKWGKGSRISFLYHEVDSELGIPFSSPGAMTPLRRQETNQRTLAIPLKWAISNRWSLEATVSSVERELDFSDPNDPWGFTWSHTETETTQARLASHHTLGSHRLSWGAEWREDEVTDGSVYGPNLEAVSYDMTSLFAQDVWSMGNALTLVLGARWDDTDQWGSEISPRANLGWRVSDTVEIQAGYGEAYRQPSVGELFYPFSGNADLKPETSDSFEVGLVWGGQGRTSPRLHFSAFSTDIDNLIVFDYVNYSLQNIGKAEINGFEAALDTVYSDALNSHLQVTWLDTSDGFGNELLRRPEWSGAYTLSGAFLSWLKGYATVRYVGNRFDVDPLTFGTTPTESFVTADLALATQIWDTIELTLRATNLLDKDYEEVLGYPAQGRRIIGGIRIDF